MSRLILFVYDWHTYPIQTAKQIKETGSVLMNPSFGTEKSPFSLLGEYTRARAFFSSRESWSSSASSPAFVSTFKSYSDFDELDMSFFLFSQYGDEDVVSE